MTLDLVSLSNPDLLAETERAATTERGATTSLIALLAEIDSRKLYLSEGFSSLFGFATVRLRLSEPAVYGRITAARTARRFPAIFGLLEVGALSLTTVGLIAPHLTDENCDALIDAVRHKSKREVERVIAALHPQPDIVSSVRALPVRVAQAELLCDSRPDPVTSPAPSPDPVSPATTALRSPADRAIVAPLSPKRYLVRMTISEETQQKLQRARDLLRHVVPDGDPAAIFDRALTVLLRETEKAKLASTKSPRSSLRVSTPGDASAGRTMRDRSRHIPAAVRRAVWSRDEGRCAFVGAERRCSETGGLEFHHVTPFAAGGAATVDNIELRCRAHNAYEGVLAFGDWRPDRPEAKAPERRAPSGQS